MAQPDEIEQGYRNAAARAADIAHPIFAANGWFYARGFGEDERRWVPSWADLYGRILGHVRTVGDEGNILSSSGRITVTRSDLGITIHLDLSRCEPRMQTGEAASVPRTTGAELIAAERRRQIEAEGWTPEHDDAQGRAEMQWAARCYPPFELPELLPISGDELSQAILRSRARAPAPQQGENDGE